MLPDILDLLSKPELNWISQTIGFEDPKAKRNQLTLAWPSRRLREKVDEYGIQLSHIDRCLDEEIIILKSTKKDPSEDYRDKAERIPYEEIPLTHQLRDELQGINQWIASADIRRNGERVSRSDLVLSRYFTQASFESGGRLFGGFWQIMKKEQRRAELTINGEPIAALDFGQMAIRILYGMEGIIPDDVDLYHIPGVSDLPGGPYRQGIKKALNSMTFRDGRMSKKPKGSIELLPKDLGIEEIEDRIRDRHADIANLFGTKVGHECQFIESNILINIILRLRDMGIACLPVHDCVLVGQSHVDTTMRIMTEVSNSVLGFPIPVELE